MERMDIAFPNLGIYLNDVPKSFQVFGFEIALYGVIIAAAMMAGFTVAAQVAKRTGQNPDLYWDAAVWLIVSSIVGARLYYVAFMWSYYKENPLQILNLRGGGLAIYGGVIAAMITLVFYARKKKESFFLMADTVVYGLVTGQIIGRWGNFFNREVFGEYTDGLLAMRIPAEMVRQRDISENIARHMQGVNYIQVHPTFLYEGIWNLGLLLLMLMFWKYRKFKGQAALLYFFGYGIGRGIIEFIRTDQLYFAGTHIPVSMCLGLFMAVAAVLLNAAALQGIRHDKYPFLKI